MYYFSDRSECFGLQDNRLLHVIARFKLTLVGQRRMRFVRVKFFTFDEGVIVVKDLHLFETGTLLAFLGLDNYKICMEMSVRQNGSYFYSY